MSYLLPPNKNFTWSVYFLIKNNLSSLKGMLRFYKNTCLHGFKQVPHVFARIWDAFNSNVGLEQSPAVGASFLT